MAVQEDLEAVDAEFRDPGTAFTSVFLINCGGTLPLTSLLPSLPEGAILYVIDSHRPYHPDNVADGHKVILLGDEDPYRDVSAGSSQDVSLAKKRHRGNKEESAGTTLVDEEGSDEDDEDEEEEDEGSYYGPSASQVALLLAESEGKGADPDILWWAIVGATDQLIHRRVSDAVYESFAQEIGRSIPSEESEDSEDQSNAVKVGGIKRKSNELRLVLLRHWNLYDSLFHSPVFATKLRLWLQNGREKLELILARVGVSLDRSKAPFSSLPDDVFRRFREKLPKAVAGIDESALFFMSFVRDFRGARRIQLSASDVVYATESILESGTDDAFWRAYSSIAAGGSNVTQLLQGIQTAIEQQQDIVRQASAMLAGKSFLMAGPFRYATLHESTLLPRFVHPMALSRLAHFLMDALNVCSSIIILNRGFFFHLFFLNRNFVQTKNL